MVIKIREHSQKEIEKLKKDTHRKIIVVLIFDIIFFLITITFAFIPSFRWITVASFLGLILFVARTVLLLKG